MSPFGGVSYLVFIACQVEATRVSVVVGLRSMCDVTELFERNYFPLLVDFALMRTK